MYYSLPVLPLKSPPTNVASILSNRNKWNCRGGRMEEGRQKVDKTIAYGRGGVSCEQYFTLAGGCVRRE